MSYIRLSPGKEKSVLNHHPWVYSGAIEDVDGCPQPGDVVGVRDATGRVLARGYYNPASQIVVRLLTWQEEDIDRRFWQGRVQAACARRSELTSSSTDAFRLVYAESDGLPGLVVDRYGEWLVLQSLTLGMERWKTTIAETLGDQLHPRGIYERSDVDVRQRERLAPVCGPLLGGTPPERLIVRENHVRLFADISSGHKTGLYLDQRDNRLRFSAYCPGRSVLNAFCYTGAFSVYAAMAGAGSITHLDSSADALRGAAENLRLNDMGRPSDEYEEGDAFRVLRKFRDQARTFDLIILDPPKFAFSRAQVASATRGYKDINLLAMRLLRPGGILCTFSCSATVSEDLFQKVLFGASLDAGREVRILERLFQGTDHPVLLSFPEGAYLKGFVCSVA